ncbi:Uncharacterised protein [Mycobacteroides abscessus]|nr:Uncharacterised protein [Mycobacteroides abscessus]
MLTPIERTLPSSRSSTNRSHTHGDASPAGGQWMSHRSTWSVPRSRSDASSVSRSRPAASGGSLVVTNTSARSTEESASARPTCASLP